MSSREGRGCHGAWHGVGGVEYCTLGIRCHLLSSKGMVMPACKLNGETEKCIIDQVDAKVSRSQHGIRFRYRVINPQA